MRRHDLKRRTLSYNGIRSYLTHDKSNKKVKFFLKYFIGSQTLDVVNFTPMKRTLLSAVFSDILGLLNLVI